LLRVSDAGHCASRIAAIGRHPKPSTITDSCKRRKQQIPARLQSGTEFGLLGDIIDWITDRARRPTRVLALGQETDFCGSQLLIHKLPTTITAATITAATITDATITAATITAATITAVTITDATITAVTITAVTITDVTITDATITVAIATAIDTARRRRRRRNIDLAAGRRSDLAAAATVIATAAPVIAATGAHRAKERGTEQRRSKEEAKCFGLGRNGGGSECESCSGHDGYPA
jgi:hypothetical protein